MPNDAAENVKPTEPQAARGKLPPWNVLLIEDNETTRRQIREYFEGRELDGRHFLFQEISDWDQAFGLIREHKADLVILDIYRGEAVTGGDRVGERVLDDIKGSGFAPVIIHTNLAEGLEGLQNEFVRLVAKTDGLERLSNEMEALFRTRVPQMHRAILNHLDRALRQYMWGFVTEEWSNLREIADRPEFLRLLLHRLAISFVRAGVEHAVAEVFGDSGGTVLDPDKAHPAEFYIKPPIASDPALGDIRLRETGGTKEYLIVLWPTCDMISTGGRTPKTDKPLCALATPLATFSEAQEYAKGHTSTKHKRLEKLLTNNRDSHLGFADRYHFLPGFLDIPNLVVDFQALEHPPLETVKGLRCLGVLGSPYAEHLSSRFDRYRGRIGTPDLDCNYVIERLPRAVAAGPQRQTDQRSTLGPGDHR